MDSKLRQEIKNQMDKLNLELQNLKENRFTENLDHANLERIRNLQVDNLVLRYDIKHQPDNQDLQIENLKVSVARCLLDTLDDIESMELNNAQLDYAFKNIFETKSRECSFQSVHIGNRILKNIICQAKSHVGQS